MNRRESWIPVVTNEEKSKTKKKIKSQTSHAKNSKQGRFVQIRKTKTENRRIG